MMDGSEKSITELKSIHKKTMVKFMLPELFIVLLILISGTIVLMWVYHPIAKGTMNFIIINNIITFLIFIVFKLVSWFSEK